jgi:hypothetical protein
MHCLPSSPQKERCISGGKLAGYNHNEKYDAYLIVQGECPMFIKTSRLGLIIAFTFILSTYGNPNITWVPSYSIGSCKTCLQKDFGGVGMKDGLTLLALQFYTPTSSGTGVSKGASDADVIWFRDWSHNNNVKVLLCVFNATNGWDWNLAKNAFANNKTAFVNALVAECTRLNLDGVDIDLEGPGSYEGDRTAYESFCTDLKKALGTKVLTIETFAAQYNAPNWNWWPGLINNSKIDGIGCMGYNETGSNGGITYASEKQHCVDPTKFMMGMLGSAGSWLGNTASQHIDWILNNGAGMGVGIWDANLGGSWQTAEIWNKMKTLKQRNSTPVAKPAQPNKVLLDKLSFTHLATGGVSVMVNLEQPGNLAVNVYDLKGVLVAPLYSNAQARGNISISWNGANDRGIKVAHGSYVIAVSTNGKTVSKQFALIR